MIKEKLNICVCYTFILIFKFKFIFIYLLHVLFVLKIKGIFKRKKFNPKVLKGVVYIHTCVIDIIFF